jgi:hypothetical protein
MNHSMLFAALLIATGLTACEKPTVVNVPPAAQGVPGPAGPQGATGDTGGQGNQGNQGVDGSKGATGATGGDTVIVLPPAASAPAN